MFAQEKAPVSYHQHDFMPYPAVSEYAGTCKHCARREQDHDLSPDELLVRTLKKGIENASSASLAFNAAIAPPVQTPVTETDVWLTKERFDLGKAVIDAAINLRNWYVEPTVPDGIEGSDRYVCGYCSEDVSKAYEISKVHKDDCDWHLFVVAVEAYEARNEAKP